MKPHIKALLSTFGFFAAIILISWGMIEGIIWLAHYVTAEQVVLALIGIMWAGWVFIMYQAFLSYWSDQ